MILTRAHRMGTKYLNAIGVGLIAWTALLPSAYAQTPSALACSPSVITGGSGDSAVCTVTLSAAAPQGGTAVTLTSSNIELAASLPTITVPAGHTTADFTVATNPGYRRYSQFAFSAVISASANGTTQSATLNVTIQSPPPDFDSGSTSGSNTQWEGLMCGGIAPIGGYPDILYDCSSATDTGFGSCTFRQECSIGCRRVPPNGEKFDDFCATSGPNPVALSRNYVVSGDRVPSAIVAEAPAGNAPAQEQGVPRVIDPNFNSTKFPQSGIAFPDGATSVGFDVATSYVPAIQFVEVGGFWFNDAIPPLLITNGRGGHAWLVMLPPNPPPSVAIPTLGDFRITGSNPVTGGDNTIGQIDLSGLSRVGGPTITLTSTHPDIVASVSVDAPATDRLLGFQVSIPTQPPAADTDVTITATDGRYSFNAVLTVLVPPPPPVLADLTVDPTSVVGGNPSTGMVLLSAAQSGDTVVTLSTPAPASVATMPSSVTVPAGATSATFTITTSPVTETFNMNVYADLAGSPSQQALLLITPPPPSLSALSLSPTSVVGGDSSTGTVTLTSAAPTGGLTVSLSDNSTATTVPDSVTVSAGNTSATFTITTTAVTTSTVATVIGTLDGTSRSADLTVTPASGGETAGFNSPSANAADSGGDGNGFEANPSNAHADDTAIASDTNSGSGTSTSCTNSGKDRHRFYNYGFSIPTDVSITGIEVRLDARADSTSGSPKICVQLSWDGGANWTTAKATATLGTSMTTFTLGSATDAWGRTWSATNFANANFRVRVINVASSTARDFFLDWIAVRPHYTTSDPASLSAVSVSPSTVTGGSSSTGTVTLTAAAPSGGAEVSLASSNTSVATVPTSVTVAAGATSATFGVTTFSVAADTSVTIAAAYNGASRTTTLTVTPPSETATLTVTATGRSGERITSSPAGIDVSVGSTGSASFAIGTDITLSVTNNRDAIWSGDCSSGGNKTKTCTFTLNAAASVTGDVK